MHGSASHLSYSNSNKDQRLASPRSKPGRQKRNSFSDSLPVRNNGPDLRSTLRTRRILIGDNSTQYKNGEKRPSFISVFHCTTQGISVDLPIKIARSIEKSASIVLLPRRNHCRTEKRVRFHIRAVDFVQETIYGVTNKVVIRLTQVCLW